MKYYKIEKPVTRFALCANVKNSDIQKNNLDKNGNIIDIIAYCIMPTHIHFVLKQKKDKGISIFMNILLNSYTRYFNTKHERKGPLWESRFQIRLVETDEYALHLSRYIHLNPTSAGLVQQPEDWEFSSYHEYLAAPKSEPLCDFSKIISYKPATYRKFTENRKDYQRSLQIIKGILLD